jgi:4-amino-4-deoxy-L-arabinose transferase-like glycosyltransferase
MADVDRDRHDWRRCLYAVRSRAADCRKLFAVASIGALLVAPILTAASVVLRRPNIAAPVANMTALLAPSDTERQALRTSRLDAARTEAPSYLIANREAAKFLVAVPNANVAAPLIISTGLPVMAIGGYLGDDPILTAGGYRAAGRRQAVALRDAGRIYPGAGKTGGGARSDRAMGARQQPPRRSETVAPVRFGQHPLPHQPRQ